MFLPIQPGLLGQGLFQHRSAVDDGAVAERADGFLNAIGQELHALAHQLVVIPAQGVARYVGFFGLCQALRHLCVAGQVVHAQRDDPQRAGHQFVRPRAFAAVGGHVVHLALVARCQPGLEMRLVLAEVDAGDPHLLEAELAAPLLDGVGEGDGQLEREVS